MKMKAKKEQKNENIWNVPNVITLARIIIAFLTMYLIFADFNIVYIVLAFVVGMITDVLDGQIARRFKIATEFGRKFDMIADRFLMIGTVLAVIIKFSIQGVLLRTHILQIFLIMAREIITFPFALITIASGKGLPKVRTIGKATTVMQAIAFPAIMLSVFYEAFNFSFYLALATSIIGLVSASYFINDVGKLENDSEKNKGAKI